MSIVNHGERLDRIDELVAEHVMQWKREEFKTGYRNYWCWVTGDDNRPTIECCRWSPSTDIAAAWEVMAIVRQEFFSTRLNFKAALVEIISKRLALEGLKVHAEEVILLVEPLDICLAALQTVPPDVATQKLVDGMSAEFVQSLFHGREKPNPPSASRRTD